MCGLLGVRWTMLVDLLCVWGSAITTMVPCCVHAGLKIHLATSHVKEDVCLSLVLLQPELLQKALYKKDFCYNDHRNDKEKCCTK